MNILHVLNAFSPVFGCGPADRCQKMATTLAARGHQVTIFTSDHSWDPQYAAQTHRAEVVPFRHHLGRFCYTPAMRGALARRIHEFDVVHLMNHWTYQNVLAFQAARQAKVPFVFSAMGALPIVYRSFRLKRAYQRLYGRHILEHASATIGITRTECRQYAQAGVDEGRIVYLPNAIDAHEYADLPHPGQFRRRFAVPPEVPLILFLGRLDPIKGPDILLEGFIRAADALDYSMLAFVGPDYGMEAELRSRVRGAGLEGRVRFPGPLTGEAKRAAYVDADVFVVPSRQENMSIVAVEAAATGTPTVITDTCDFPEIDSYGAGRVVRPTADEIVAAVRELLSDPQMRAQAGRNAQRMVAERFTWQVIGRRLEEVLDRVVSGRPVNAN